MAKTDQEMGEALYGKPAGQAEQAPEEKVGERKAPLQRKEWDDHAALVMYPEHSDRYPLAPEGGYVNQCIRDRSGKIIAQADAESVGKVAQGAWRLDHANLSKETIDVELNAPSMQDSDCSGLQLPPSGAIVHGDLRGTSFESAQLHGALRFCDLRGVQWEGADVSNLDLTGSTMDPDSYIELSQCKGFSSVKGARMPNRHVLPKATG
jgi:hypothetical protein